MDKHDVAHMLNMGRFCTSLSSTKQDQLAASFQCVHDVSTDIATEEVTEQLASDHESYNKILYKMINDTASEVLGTESSKFLTAFKKRVLSQKKNIPECQRICENLKSKQANESLPMRSCRPLPPLNGNGMRSTFREGTFAMDELIPHPPICNHHDHAYILMEDAISDLLGHGYKLDYICEASSSDENMPLEIKKMSETKRAHKMFKVFATGPDQKPVVIWVLKWSDDAEMNSLLQNKGSVWIQSATFSVPEDSLNVAACTCVMAIGPKEGDHSFCEKMLNESLTKLSSPSEFYHGGLKANVKVGAALFASIADQPEKDQSMEWPTGMGPAQLFGKPLVT